MLAGNKWLLLCVMIYPSVSVRRASCERLEADVNNALGCGAQGF